MQIIIRFVFLLFYIFLVFLHGYRNQMYSLGLIEDRDNNYLLNINSFISKTIRKFFSRRKCRQFLKKNNNIYTLSNSMVSISYNTRENEVFCFNKKNTEQKFKVYDYQVKTNNITNYIMPNEIFDESFDNICSAFDAASTYTGVKEFYEQYYDIEKSDVPQKSKPAAKQTVQKGIMSVEEYFGSEITKPVNINSASAEEISKLPGISIIVAKKIIKYRELHNGFSSKEEFFKQIKIQPHFQEKLNKLISIEKSQNNANIVSNDDERIIDF